MRWLLPLAPTSIAPREARDRAGAANHVWSVEEIVGLLD